MIKSQTQWISNFFGATPTVSDIDNHNMQWAEWKLVDLYVIVYESKPYTWFAISEPKIKNQRRSASIINSKMPSTENYFKLMMQAIGIKKPI